MSIPNKDSYVLEILLNFTFFFWKQREFSIPLRATKELQQITHLLFTYYVSEKNSYSIDQVISILVERIFKLNSEILNRDHSFLSLLDFMEKNINRSLRVSDFCEMTHLSESSVNRLCIDHTGITAMKLFRKIQCWEAERLLNETSLTIKEISGKLGFKNSKSFSTMYRKNEGTTLLEKRKNDRGKTLWMEKK